MNDTSFWQSLTPASQDAVVFAVYLLPAVLVGLFVTRGFGVSSMVRALLSRYRITNAIFVLLMAVAIAIGIGLSAQERGLRESSARAADKFEVIIASPGSQMQATLASVFLQPSGMDMLSGDVMQRLTRDPQVNFAAPTVFGDNVDGTLIVGTTAQFVSHLSEGLSEGRIFASINEAVMGSRVKHTLGATLRPKHGVVNASDARPHSVLLEVVGRMQPTGSPWDNAIVVPVESVWAVHGRGTGHSSSEDKDLIGPPFSVEDFPGAPVIIAQASNLTSNEALAKKYTTVESMGFFPQQVLSQMHDMLGDARKFVSLIAGVTQALVVASMLLGLSMLAKLFARRFALLRALGAPKRFIFSVTWCYAVILIVAAAILGLVIGVGGATLISQMITERTNITTNANIGWRELQLTAAFISIASLFALIPAAAAFSRPPVKDLRG